ncbi:hypothetical protein SCALM49S_04106 [Streptomyces californicus]
MSSTTGTRGESVTPANPAVDTVADTTDVTALLERGRALSAPVLRAAVDRLAPPMDTVAAYHFGWIDADGRPSDGDGGKAVRPALALLSAEAAGAPAEAGIPGAVAVELVHNFSLLHDDLMDGDEQRRHRDTVWKVHGPAQAILVGDALFALAYDLLLELGTVEAGRAARRLTTASRKLIDGQAQDISYEHRERVTVEECLEMEGNKTGALLACAVSIGAVLGGADDRTADTLEAYGYHLGLAFQAVDDLLGIWGDPESTGKQTWSDLRQRKKSLPVVAALAAGGEASERLGELLAADAKSNDFDSFSEEEFAARAALTEAAGGRERTAWDEPYFTGTGFPWDFSIDYHLYRQVFPLTALAASCTADPLRRPRGRRRGGLMGRPRGPASAGTPLLIACALGIEQVALRSGRGAAGPVRVLADGDGPPGGRGGRGTGPGPPRRGARRRRDRLRLLRGPRPGHAPGRPRRRRGDPGPRRHHPLHGHRRPGRRPVPRPPRPQGPHRPAHRLRPRRPGPRAGRAAGGRGDRRRHGVRRDTADRPVPRTAPGCGRPGGRGRSRA